VGQDTQTDGADQDDGRGPFPFAALVLFEAALAPLALTLGWALGQPPLERFAWDAAAALDGAAAAVPMLLFLAATIRWPVGPLRPVKEFFDRELAPLLEGCRWPDLALVSVAAGVGEEMLFRGVLQAAIARALGPAAGVVLAAALFGLLHPISLAYIVLVALLGAYLGVVWLATGNLLSVMVAHALYDFIALVVLLRGRADAEGGGPDGA
jgi:membrane protease YdiL (CAAX protease family)